MTNLVVNKNIKKQKKILQTNSFTIFWDCSMFYQNDVLRKRWTIIIYRHGIGELPHELQNNVRLRILEN